MNKQITVFSGVLIHENKLFLLQRSEVELPEAHLKWEFPGGKVDFGETPQEALRREFSEETGIEIKVKELLPFVQTAYWDYDWGTQQTLCFAFRCEFIQQQKVIKKDHHVEQTGWFTLGEIMTMETLPGIDKLLQIITSLP